MVTAFNFHTTVERQDTAASSFVTATERGCMAVLWVLQRKRPGDPDGYES